MTKINESHIKSVLGGVSPRIIAEKMADITVRSIKTVLKGKRQTATPAVQSPGVLPHLTGIVDPKVTGTGKSLVAQYQKISDKGDGGVQPSLKTDSKAMQQLKRLRESLGNSKKSVMDSDGKDLKNTGVKATTQANDKLANKFKPEAITHHTKATGHQHTVVVFKPMDMGMATKFRSAVNSIGWASSVSAPDDKDVTVIVNHDSVNEACALFIKGFLHEDGETTSEDYVFSAGKALSIGHDLEEAWRNASGKRSGNWHPFITSPIAGGKWVNIVRKTGQHIGGTFSNRHDARAAADSMSTRMTPTKAK